MTGRPECVILTTVMTDESLTVGSSEPQERPTDKREDGGAWAPTPTVKPEKPLAAARRRLDRAERAKKLDLPHLSTYPDIAIGMAAAGLPASKISKALGVSASKVEDQLALPEAMNTITAIRDNLKLRKMQSMYRSEARLYARIERDVEKADAKDVDALARAAMNMEKIQAQVSGEGQTVNVKNQSETPTLDLKLLIQNMIRD